MIQRAGNACFLISPEEIHLKDKFDFIPQESDFFIEEEVISFKGYVKKKMPTVALYVDDGASEKASSTIVGIKSMLTPADGDIRLTMVQDTISPKGWNTYVKEVFPEFGTPKIVVTFGAFSAYPFFFKQAKKDPRWFDVVHTRLHEKTLGETKFLLFVFPCLDSCLDPEFRSLMNNQLKMVKALIGGIS